MAETLVLTEEEKKLREELEVEYAQKLKDEVIKIQKDLNEQNKKVIEKTIEEFKKKMEPPTPEEIQKLLDQEYLEFTVEVPAKQGGGKKSFVLRELPQSVEKKFYRKLKERLVPLASDIASMSINLLEGDASRKITNILNTFEPMLDVLAYAATLSLNPYAEEEGIDDDWVQSHLSSTRIMQIVNAQMEINRMRDFFSTLSKQSRLGR